MLAKIIIGIAKLLSGLTVYSKAFEQDKQRIYFANHTSHLDFVILWAALPPSIRKMTRPVAAKDYWWKSKLRTYIIDSVFNGIVIDRNREEGEDPIETILDGLGSDYSIIIFPEGTRNLGEGMNSFKSGLYHLAKARPEIELIPVYLENLSRILPKGEFLPVPFLSSARFGDVIQLEPDESKEDFLERAKQSVEVLGQHEAI